jgi:hypothetical protein
MVNEPDHRDRPRTEATNEQSCRFVAYWMGGMLSSAIAVLVAVLLNFGTSALERQISMNNVRSGYLDLKFRPDTLGVGWWCGVFSAVILWVACELWPKLRHPIRAA